MSTDSRPDGEVPPSQGVIRSLRGEYGPYRRWPILIGCIGGAVAVAELGVVFLIAALASSLVGDSAGGMVGLSSLSPTVLAALAVAVVLFRGMVDLLDTTAFRLTPRVTSTSVQGTSCSVRTCGRAGTDSPRWTPAR